MGEKNDAKQKEKASKTKRQTEDKKLLTPTFAAMRQATSERQQTASPGGNVLQRHRDEAASGEPGEMSGQVFSDPGFDLDFSAVPARAISTSSGQPIQPNLSINAPGDAYEQEADRIADDVMRMAAPAINAPLSPATGPLNPIVSRYAISRIQASGSTGAFQAPPHVEASINQMQHGGEALPDSERTFFESRMGFDFSDVRVHTDEKAIQTSRDIQAHAFTVGSHIAFNQGAYQPGTDAGRRLLAHELTHVVQQTGAAQRKIQRTINPSYEVTHGTFNVAATTGGSNLPITIGFHPKETAPYSNQIGLIQVVKLTDGSGNNIEPRSLSAARAASVRTTADAASGVEGGFFTDVPHRESFSGGPPTDTPQGSDLAPQYRFGRGPSQPDTPTPGLSRPNSGKSRGAIIGYKRSNDAADIKDAELTDAPGYPSVNPANPDLSFKFETVAKGEDSMTIYGALKWHFDIQSGVVANEDASVDDSQSATFDEALRLHRNFYVHEPVIFYFDFNSRTLSADEANKIDEFLPYLRDPQNADVKVSATGFADRRGGASEYNLQLSLDRANAVGAALRTKGVPESQIEGITVGAGATEDFTPDATTDQDEEANRRGNRRVVLTFRHTGSPGAGGGGGTGGGGGSGTP